jgi:hypothetical protein
MTRLSLKAAAPLLVLVGLVQPIAATSQSAAGEAGTSGGAAQVTEPVELSVSTDGSAGGSMSPLAACEADRAAAGCSELLMRSFVCEQAPEMISCATVAELSEPQTDVTPPEADSEVYVEPRAEGAIESGLDEDIPANADLEMYDEPEEEDE